MGIQASGNSFSNSWSNFSVKFLRQITLVQIRNLTDGWIQALLFAFQSDCLNIKLCGRGESS